MFPELVLVILLGASTFPLVPQLASAEAFRRSYNGIKEYFLSPEGFGLQSDNNLLDLFDIDKENHDILETIGQWIQEKVTDSSNGEKSKISNVIVYYVGHGGFKDGSHDYCLAIRRSKQNDLYHTSLPVERLANTLRESARHLRRYVIIDACFAGAATIAFQSMNALETVIKEKITNIAWNDESEIESGTALLVSTSKHNVSEYDEDGLTVYSDALLKCLWSGTPEMKDNYLSFSDMHKLVSKEIRISHGKSAINPEIHSPDQQQGIVALYRIFPNRAATKKVSSSKANAARNTYTLAENSIIRGKKTTYIIKRLPTQDTPSVSYIVRSVDAEERQFFVKTMRVYKSWSPDQIEKNLKNFDQHISNELDKSRRLQNARVQQISHVEDVGTYELQHEIGKVLQIPFLVQAYVEGDNLEKFIKEKITHHKPFSGIEDWGEWAEFARKLLEILDSVHKAGVVHGDIHPKNIIVIGKNFKDAQPHLVDFGQAFFWNFFRNEESSIPEISSKAFAAPERKNSRIFATTSSDIYSIGAVLFYLATGEEPPEAIEHGTLIATKFALKERVLVAVRKNTKLTSACSGVTDIIIQCLHFHSSERARHTEDILRLLDTYRYASSTEAETTSPNIGELAMDVAKEVAAFNQFVGHSELIKEQLFSRMIQTKLNQVLRTLKDVQAGNLVEITGTRDEIIDGFLNYLSILKNGDRYLTWTQPRFWQPNNLGISGRFMRMNELLARKYAICVRRVFLISEEDYELEYFNEIIQTQQQLMSDLSNSIDTNSRSLEKSGFYTGYKIVSPETQRAFFEWHDNLVGLLRNFNEGTKQFEESVAVTFNLEGLDQAIRRIVLWKMSKERADKLELDMMELLADSKPIAEFQTNGRYII